LSGRETGANDIYNGKELIKGAGNAFTSQCIKNGEAAG
jgi:hypothetical protein